MTRFRFATLILVALSLGGCVMVPVARHAHLGIACAHDVGAVIRAREPARHHLVGRCYARRNVLSDDARRVPGAPYPVRRPAAVAALMVEVVEARPV